MGGGTIAFIAVLAILFLIIIWGISAYNGFVKLKNQCEEAFSTMDVYLEKRHDLIPNLVNTVKGYAKHESETLEKVIAARNMAVGAKTSDEKVEAENVFEGALKSLFAVAEAYPDLKANQNFIDLQSKLSGMEGEIANSRKYYNAVVKTFNTKTEVFPSVIIANMFKFARKPLYEVESESNRKNVDVEF